jgi:hypothetical protein
VRIIALTEQTDFSAIAVAHSLSGVDPANRVSLRRLHGQLMKRLSQSGARVVVWDISFVGETEFDQDFAAGAQALRRGGCDVVVGMSSWQPVPGITALSPTIAPHVKVGAMTGGLSAEAPWRAHVAVMQGLGVPAPSASLLAAAAFVKPGYDVVLDFDRLDNNLLTIGFVPSRSTDAGLIRQFESLQVWRISGWDQLTDAGPRQGLAAGALLANLVVQVPENAVLESASTDYGEVFNLADDALKDRFAGRAVLIGDQRRAGGDGPFAHSDGRSLAGYVAQACAIDAMIRQEAIGLPITRDLWGLRLPDLWTISAAAGTLGIGLAGLAVRRHGRRIVLLALGATLLLAASAAAYSKLHYLCNPAIPAVAMVVAAESWAYASRLRRRVTFAG